MPTPDHLIARLAIRQHGLFTYDQALQCGFTPDVIGYRLRSGRWQRVHKGVYRVAGAVTSFEQRAMAAALAAGPGVGASHRTAGGLFQLEGIDRNAIEVICARRVRISGVSAHVSTTLRPGDLTTIVGIPVTTPSRTFIDLASALERDPLEDALDDAIRRRIIHPRRLEQELEGRVRRGCKGLGVLLELLRTRTTRNVPGSGRENRVRRALKAAGLPEPVRQLAIYDETGMFVARPDLAYPDLLLYIEYDGGWHESPRQRRADVVRQNRLSELGWRPLRFETEDVRGSLDALVESVRAASSVNSRR